MIATFRNLESAGNPLSFNRQGEDYHFEADKEYTITDSIFDHINGLGMPRYEFRQDPISGKLETKKVGWIPRFSFTEVREKRVAPANNEVAPANNEVAPANNEVAPEPELESKPKVKLGRPFGTAKKEPALSQG